MDTITLVPGSDTEACAMLVPTLPGAEPTTVPWSNGGTTLSIEVCDTISGWYYVTLTDDTLCTAVDTVLVYVEDVPDISCGTGGSKVLLCHIPPNDPANAHTICISQNAVAAHLAHGCVLGPCEPVVADSLDGGQTDLQLAVAPNSMNGQALASVRSAIAQRVRVSVVDALGRRSPLLLDAEMTAGEERMLVLDEGQMPQGATVAWLEAETRTGREVLRLVLLR